MNISLRTGFRKNKRVKKNPKTKNNRIHLESKKTKIKHIKGLLYMIHLKMRRKNWKSGKIRNVGGSISWEES